MVVMCADTQTSNLPCSYSWAKFNHGESIKTDECTVCHCDNGTVGCDTKQCPRPFCGNPVKFDGVCCDICIPYGKSDTLII